MACTTVGHKKCGESKGKWSFGPEKYPKTQVFRGQNFRGVHFQHLLNFFHHPLFYIIYAFWDMVVICYFNAFECQVFREACMPLDLNICILRICTASPLNELLHMFV